MGKHSEQQEENGSLSVNLLESFTVFSSSLFMHNFPEIYKDILTLIPGDKISFGDFDNDISFGCEIICATICHKINWDFLRYSIYKKTVENPSWVFPEHLKDIKSSDIQELLSDYDKPERIQADERSKLLRALGSYIYDSNKTYKDIFKNEKGELFDYHTIYSYFKSCMPFVKDPENKKFQLILQNISNYDGYRSLGHCCRAAVDYHLIRYFLRRGLIRPQTIYAKEYIRNNTMKRKEQTVASLRNLCAGAISELCWKTSLDVKTINKIEWWMGRSVCIAGSPDCDLQLHDAQWLKKQFSECPFSVWCYTASKDKDYLKITEPNYKGNSY